MNRSRRHVVAPRNSTRVLALVSVTLGFSFHQQEIPVRTVQSNGASAAEAFGLIFAVYELRDGRVLVNDPEHLRMVAFDSSLSRLAVVSDNTPGALIPYGDVPAQLIRYRGDSLLFVSGASRTLLLLDPRATFVRAVALPKAADFRLIAGSRVAVDRRGRLVYRGAYPPVRTPVIKPPGKYVTPGPSTAPLVRADFETRQVDTIGTIRLPVTQSLSEVVSASGASMFTSKFFPLDVADDWEVVSNGTVAVVRGQDYHVDWIDEVNAVTSTPKMPFAWQRIPDPDKTRMADSVRAAMQLLLDTANARSSRRPPPDLPPGSVALPRMTSSFNRIDGTTTSMPMKTRIVVATPSEIVDYYPPIHAGAVKADNDGNLWILPRASTAMIDSRIVYDLVNPQGTLFERVRLPVGRSIAGFGRRGTIFLMYKDSASIWRLEKSHVVR